MYPYLRSARVLLAAQLGAPLDFDGQSVLRFRVWRDRCRPQQAEATGRQRARPNALGDLRAHGTIRPPTTGSRHVAPQNS